MGPPAPSFCARPYSEFAPPDGFGLAVGAGRSADSPAHLVGVRVRVRVGVRG